MSHARDGAHLRAVPPLTEEERIAAAKAELAQIGARIRTAILDRTTAPRYDGKSNPEGGNR